MGGNASSTQPSPPPSQPTASPPKLLSDKPWRQLAMSGPALEKSVLKDINELKPMKVPLLLLLGPVGAGKSSLINSFLSVGAGRKKSVAQTGSAASSYSLKLKTYKDSGILKNFRLVDSMGIEPKHGQGFHTDDIFYLLQGHVKKSYQFDPARAMTTESKFYRKNPKFKHFTHCVVFVLDARTIHGGIPAAYVEKIQILQEQIKNAEVPRVLILTHVDMLCDKVKENASNLFRSLKVEVAMKRASAVFCIEMASIHPVMNYEEDFELTTAKNIPILLALRQIMQYACDRVECYINESESESSEDDEISKKYDELLNVVKDEIFNLTSLKKSMYEDHFKKYRDTLGEIIGRLEMIAREDDPPEKMRKTDEGAIQHSLNKVRTSMQKVIIMNPTKTSSSCAFVPVLMQMMNGFGCKCSEVNKEMDDNVPLIVVCQAVSRLQPDVDMAIQSVQRSSPYVVIILYIGSERNLPLYPSKQKLQEYRNITFIDMGFNDQGVIYECQHNTDAKGQLRFYIDTYQPETTTSGVTGTNQPETSKSGSSTSLELSSSTRNPDPSSPVRHTEQHKLLSDKPWRQLFKRGDELVESVIKDIKELELKKDPLFRLLRHVGAGKSSFINSCMSVGACRKKVLAITGRAASSYSLEDDEVLKHFQLTDSMVEPVFDFHTNDIVYLLEGHVEKTYEFDPEKPMTTESKFYRKKPNFEHKTHCVVFVLDARTMHCDIPDVYIEKIKDLQDKIKLADVPRVLILTHVDMLCDEVKKDASNIFRSLKVEEAMKKASAVFCIEMASIHPVINYEEQNSAKNILILLALRQSMHYACDRAEQVLNESENESSEENDSD